MTPDEFLEHVGIRRKIKGGMRLKLTRVHYETYWRTYIACATSDFAALLTIAREVTVLEPALQAARDFAAGRCVTVPQFDAETAPPSEETPVAPPLEENSPPADAGLPGTVCDAG